VTPQILYVCVHNAGRSIAAAVLTEHLGRGRVEVRSAGSAPGSEVNPSVAAVLRERGLDPDRHFPKPLTDIAARDADVIVTMGCGDACPFYPGKRYLDWELDDPAGKSVEEVRPIVEEIDKRVRALLRELLVNPCRRAPDVGSVGGMDDQDILERINKLVDEEHELRTRGAAGLKEDEEARLRHLEEGLDQCWDLLRQRRAKRHTGQDPEEAHARDIDTVEHYRQ
jgi:protein-tyrosine-phosphatase